MDTTLAAGLLDEIEARRSVALSSKEDGWVFPSERLTPLSKDNCWRRYMLPKLQAVGLGWANFQVMRRTHATLMRQLKADPKPGVRDIEVETMRHGASPSSSRCGY